MRIVRTGPRICQISGWPNIGRINARSKINPYWFRVLSTSKALSFGSRPIKIFPPSRGWIGIKLNTARKRLN